MRALEPLHRVARTLQALVPPRRPDFICGDCYRWQRCGLPPDENCEFRAAQLADNNGRWVRRTTLTDWASWGY